MRDFLARHSYLIVWISALAIIGAVAFLILQLNTIIPSVTTHYTPSKLSPSVTTPSPAIPQSPSVTFTIEKSSSGNTLVVQWQYLPAGTTAINIFRSAKDENQWSLWKTVTIPSGQIGQGTASFSIGPGDTDDYSYYVAAVDNNNGTNGSSTPPLWTSPPSDPIVTVPPSNGGPGTDNPPQDNPPASPSGTPSTPSSTNPASSPSSSNPGNSNNPDNPVSENNPPSTPPGNPYYNPQVQITGYGTAPGSFWVEHVNQSVEIGWQDLPSNVDTITIARSVASNGPWNTILTQQNPGTTGSYSLQIVDDSLQQPYYYEMIALNGTTTIATYGPAELIPN